MTNKIRENLSNILLALAALITPSIVLLHLYVRNYYRGVRLLHCFWFGFIFGLLSVGVYLLLYKLTKLREWAIVLIVLLWAVFWFFNQIYSLFNKAIVTPAALIVILLLIGGGGQDTDFVNLSLYLP